MSAGADDGRHGGRPSEYQRVKAHPEGEKYFSKKENSRHGLTQINTDSSLGEFWLMNTLVL